jgi:MFS family permease
MSNLDKVIDRESPDRRIVVAALGITQILAWGSTFYLLGVLANEIARNTGWSYDWVTSGVSIGLLVAGAVSPRVGRAISKWGGRFTLGISAILLAAGLLLLGSAQSIAWYLVAWLILGVGMGCGLTDAAFSTLGSIYGEDARGPITALTLFAGFASTVCWPLSAYLIEHLGWREACFTYAAIQIGVALPVLLLALPRGSPIPPPRDDEGARSGTTLAPGELSTFALLAVVLTLSAAILSMMGIHLLPLLQARGLELSVAVGLGAIVGPSQVGAPYGRDADWSTLPPNLDDDIIRSSSSGRYSAVVCGLSNLLRRCCTVWRREWTWIYRSRHFGVGVVWIIPVLGADGAPRTPDFNVNGSIAISSRDCLSSRRGELNSWTYYVARRCKRVAGQLALDANTTALRVSPWLMAAHGARHHRRDRKRFRHPRGGLLRRDLPSAVLST